MLTAARLQSANRRWRTYRSDDNRPRPNRHRRRRSLLLCSIRRVCFFFFFFGRSGSDGWRRRKEDRVGTGFGFTKRARRHAAPILRRRRRLGTDEHDTDKLFSSSSFPLRPFNNTHNDSRTHTTRRRRQCYIKAITLFPFFFFPLLFIYLFFFKFDSRFESVRKSILFVGYARWLMMVRAAGYRNDERFSFIFFLQKTRRLRFYTNISSKETGFIDKKKKINNK